MIERGDGLERQPRVAVGRVCVMACGEEEASVWVLIRGEYYQGVVDGERGSGSVEVLIPALGCTLQVEESDLFICNKVINVFGKNKMCT